MKKIIEKLDKLIEEGNDLLKEEYDVTDTGWCLGEFYVPEELFRKWNLSMMHFLEINKGISDTYVKFFEEEIDNSSKSIKIGIKILKDIKDEIKDGNMPHFTNDFETMKKTDETQIKPKDNQKKVFISHSSKDKHFADELIEILEYIGVPSENIFCTSVEGYGTPLGENFLETIKNELTPNTLVLFLISENFYGSPVSLCEMGATWIQSNFHIPILIPPMTFEDVEGVIPLTEGLLINDKTKINSLKIKIENDLTIKNKKNDFTKWERKRDKFLKRIEEIIESNNISNSETEDLDTNNEDKNKKLKENINQNISIKTSNEPNGNELNEKSLDENPNHEINNDSFDKISTTDIKNNLKSNLSELRKEIQKNNKDIGTIRSLYKSIDEDLDFVNVNQANVNNFKKFFKPAVNYGERPIIGEFRTKTPVDDFIICIDNLFDDINRTV